MQKRVDDYYGMFVGAVAQGRRVGRDVVRSDFGQGRMVRAAEAVRLDMVDRAGTLDAQLSRRAPAAGAQAVGGTIDLETRRRRHRMLELTQPDRAEDDRYRRLQRLRELARR